MLPDRDLALLLLVVKEPVDDGISPHSVARVLSGEIEDGILEARFGLAGLDDRPGRKGKRNGRRNHHSGSSAAVTVKPDRSATQTTAKAERPAPRFRFKAPVKTVATVIRARPITLTNAELRTRLGLPPREAQAA